jgi:hypothetical protein
MVFVAAGMDVLDNVQFRNLIDFNIEMFLGLASCYTPGELLFCNLCFFFLFLIIALTLWMQLQPPLLFSFFEVAGGMKGCLVVAWPVWWFHGEGKEAAQESTILR